MMGMLANNLFEIGYAKRMSEELCWPVWYRTAWQGELSIHNERAQVCFPNAGFNFSQQQPLSPGLQAALSNNGTIDLLTPNYWNDTLSLKKSNKLYEGWLKNLEEEGIAYNLGIPHLRRHRLDSFSEVVQELRRAASHKLQLLDLGAFFINKDWMIGWEDRLAHYLQVNDQCCLGQPPPEAVVIHVRDFDDANINDGGDGLNQGIRASVYLQIMERYNLLDRPLWIVCRPRSVKSTIVQELIQGYTNSSSDATNVTIYTGIDAYDAFCTLTRAKTLLLTSASTYSQMAAILAGINSKNNGDDDTTQVHYPLRRLMRPKATVEMLDWKYHLTTTRDVKVFDMNTKRITFKEG